MQIQRVEIDGRRWYRGPDGMLHPSASSVLDILFPGSRDWVTEDALVRGTICHEEMAKAMLASVNGEVYTEHVDPAVSVRIAAVLEYLSRFQLEVMAIESPILFLGIGMTPDLVVKEFHPNGGWIKHLYDYKFAESIIDQYYFQAELYGIAEEADKVTLLQCTREGKVFVHKVKAEAERWELIKSAVNIRLHIDRKVKRHV